MLVFEMRLYKWFYLIKKLLSSLLTLGKLGFDSLKTGIKSWNVLGKKNWQACTNPDFSRQKFLMVLKHCIVFLYSTLDSLMKMLLCGSVDADSWQLVQWLNQATKLHTHPGHALAWTLLEFWLNSPNLRGRQMLTMKGGSSSCTKYTMSWWPVQESLFSSVFPLL